ncbi:MAG: hypothetical protein AAGA63_11110 [Pseudomonadota bacterium]
MLGPNVFKTSQVIDPIWVRIAVLLTALVAFVHVNIPYRFALTQIMFDYSQGWTRRGLVGTLLHPIIAPTFTLQEAYYVAMAITAFGGIVLWVFMWRRLKNDLTGVFLMLLFVSSVGFAIHWGAVGYLDSLLLACAVWAICALERGKWWGSFAALALMVLAISIHENALPYFVPTVCFVAYFCASSLRRGILNAAVVFVGCAIFTYVLLTVGQLAPNESEALVELIRTRAEFEPHNHALAVGGRTVLENFDHFAFVRSTSPYWTWVVFDGVLLAIATSITIWINLNLARSRPILTKVLMVLAIIAPWSLNIIAYDIPRFGAASILCGFMIAAVQISRDRGAIDALRHILTLPVFLVLLLLNVFSGTQPMNTGKVHIYRLPYAVANHVPLWMAEATQDRQNFD